MYRHFVRNQRDITCIRYSIKSHTQAPWPVKHLCCDHSPNTIKPKYVVPGHRAHSKRLLNGAVIPIISCADLYVLRHVNLN